LRPSAAHPRAQELIRAQNARVDALLALPALKARPDAACRAQSEFRVDFIWTSIRLAAAHAAGLRGRVQTIFIRSAVHARASSAAKNRLTARLDGT